LLPSDRTIGNKVISELQSKEEELAQKLNWIRRSTFGSLAIDMSLKVDQDYCVIVAHYLSAEWLINFSSKLAKYFDFSGNSNILSSAVFLWMQKRRRTNKWLRNMFNKYWNNIKSRIFHFTISAMKGQMLCIWVEKDINDASATCFQQFPIIFFTHMPLYQFQTRILLKK